MATEVFVYDARLLVDTLGELAQNQDELEDFGDDLLPRLVERGKAYAYPLPGYWRDVGTLESYWQGHMDLLGSDPALGLDDDEWPILTRGLPGPPARVDDGARLAESLVSPGARVAGDVSRSVLGPGVVVEPRASVRESVLLHDVVVRAGASVERAIVDAEARVEAPVGGDGELVVAHRDGRVQRAVELG